MKKKFYSINSRSQAPGHLPIFGHLVMKLFVRCWYWSIILRSDTYLFISVLCTATTVLDRVRSYRVSITDCLVATVIYVHVHFHWKTNEKGIVRKSHDRVNSVRYLRNLIIKPTSSFLSSRRGSLLISLMPWKIQYITMCLIDQCRFTV